MLDLQRLRLLTELHRRGTVTAVGEALSYSPSTVSHQLAALQREAGVPLFERDGRVLRLTEAAHVLVRHADVLLDRVERAEAEMAAAAGAVTGVVRISVFQTATRLLAPVLADLSARHPGLRVETRIEIDQALGALERRDCDLAVVWEDEHAPRPRPAGLAFEVLHEEHMLLVLPAGHPAAALPHADIPALESAVWAGGPPGFGHGRTIQDTCRRYGGFTPDLRHHTADEAALLTLVAAGQAVTLLPELAHPERAPGVVVRRITDPPVIRRVLTVTRRASLSRPALATVRAELARAVRRDGAPDTDPP
ncbi:LysR family transcriptional regulator [Actinomadura kijaniata]|uniref:DNA-binding transcriptional LysR family regulator n=1 Tax=Actinomadura namibiensis TaxID=182080 RepID=A0A7W3LTY3_ACTNM|nr:LysR family transcriptional regulator [Actinomadura namibiensis]MBA8954230.1 DNA-binding transcriptional LysR family regulator [Actinomadura namibiensis]